MSKRPYARTSLIFHTPRGNARNEYAVVTAVEPHTPTNLPVIGSDSCSHPTRRTQPWSLPATAATTGSRQSSTW
ncbi:MAG: CHASE domain-containing protein [Betaproteobacteria bacterium]|uniref:CHASE domain-containing protein n=1 Tax=Candidatus Proximibacter danicus TaxID=2954365 RepID=A0A9D7K3P3_9PROT|nr:CHASE domain-containing protein [Candidatus Proximibacter danicus]